MTDPQNFAHQIVADMREANPFKSYATDPARSVAQAYDVQDAVAQTLTDDPAFGSVAGWKIAANSASLMTRFGLTEPLSGRVFAAQCHESNTTLRAKNYRQFAFEPEIAAILKDDLTPLQAPFDEATVMRAVERLVPSLELLDMRDTDMATVHIPDAVAQNISNAGAILGGPGTRPDALDLAKIRTVVTINGKPVHDVTGAAPQHPIAAVTWLANHLASRGLKLEAGNFVLCGTHSPICYLEGAGSISVDMSGLGEVAVTLD